MNSCDIVLIAATAFLAFSATIIPTKLPQIVCCILVYSQVLPKKYQASRGEASLILQKTQKIYLTTQPVAEITSSRVVSPAKTLFQPYSFILRNPSCRACS